MVPQVFEHLTELPLTANGKVNRAALPQPHLKSSTEFVAPRNETEESVLVLWQIVFENKTIGVNDNFFELGGNSFKIVHLMNLLNNKYPAMFKINELFSNATIALQAEHIIAKNDQALNDNDKKELTEIDF
jgi:hypothetical protein